MIKSKSILLIVIALATLLLVGPMSGCKIDFIRIESGLTYHDTITISDIRDGMLRAHVYALETTAGDTYTIELRSMSEFAIQLWECNDIEAQILEVYGMGNKTIDWTFESTGMTEIWVEAFEDELPAEYSLRITKR